MIKEQLEQFCDCVDIKEKDVDELVGLVSMATCWTQEPCDTFLAGERREIINLPDCVDDCFVFEFRPFYHPFENYLDSFRFTLVTQKGMEEETTDIADFKYSDVDGVFRMELPVPSCKCKPDCSCGCEKKYKLIAEYIAGYDELPECLLPLFCEAIYYIKEKNTCDCEECQTCATDSNNIQLVDYAEGATITDRLGAYFIDTLTEQYKRELSLISLCDNEPYYGGIIV